MPRRDARSPTRLSLSITLATKQATAHMAAGIHAIVTAVVTSQPFLKTLCCDAHLYTRWQVHFGARAHDLMFLSSVPFLQTVGACLARSVHDMSHYYWSWALAIGAIRKVLSRAAARLAYQTDQKKSKQ